MRDDHEKRGILLLAVTSLVGLTLLAVVLNSFTFSSPDAPGAPSGGGILDQADSKALTRILLFFTLCLLPVMVMALLLAARRRRWLLLLVLLGCAVIFTMMFNRPVQQQPTSSPAKAGVVTQDIPQNTQAAQAESPDVGKPQVTSGLIWLLSLMVTALLIGLGALGWLAWRKFNEGWPSPLEAIAISAETALQALEQGADVQSTILNCYQAMLSAAQQSKGVERPGHLTPAEFILRLVQAGLPKAPVERLTHLFEEVRYSPQAPSTAMEAEAIACLQDVVAAARGDA